MAFRANESAASGREHAHRYLTPRELKPAEARKTREFIDELIERLGPVINAYPTWHPLVANHDAENVVTTPGDRCGYRGIDHTICFRDGFVTCPYEGGDKAVLDSVSGLPPTHAAEISADPLDVRLYHPNARPVLVRCKWSKPLLIDGTIPAAIAVPMILQREVPMWERSSVGETWETMRPYFLGQPCGMLSSLFINQETGTTIRRIWKLLVNTGAFGPLAVGQY